MDPIIDTSSSLLILGSYPGEVSLRRREYYANPTNQFWKILAFIFREPAPSEWQDKINFLARHGIALWDVMEYAERKGSADAAIKDAKSKANDLANFLKTHPHIKALAFNGQKAQNFHNQFIKPYMASTTIPEILLPSSSAARAEKLEKKISDPSSLPESPRHSIVVDRAESWNKLFCMKTEMGEYLVGAYLKVILGCGFIDYNVRHPGGGLKGLGEIDVIGIDFKKKAIYLCEVTTHIRGLQYGAPLETIRRLKYKYKRLKVYSREHFGNFREIYMFWSPYVPEGKITRELEKLKKLELIINQKYADCIETLRKEARKRTNDEGNPAFRLLQILEHVRNSKK